MWSSRSDSGDFLFDEPSAAKVRDSQNRACEIVGLCLIAEFICTLDISHIQMALKHSDSKESYSIMKDFIRLTVIS